MRIRLRSRVMAAAALFCAALVSLAAAVPASAADPPLPAWPDDFGRETRVTVSDHATGYSAVPGPDGQAWCFFTCRVAGAGEQDSGSTIAYVRVAADGAAEAGDTVATTTGEVTAFAVAANSNRAVVAWIERSGDDYTLKSTSVVRSPEGTYQSEPPASLLHVGSVLSEIGVALVADEPVFAWIDQEEGRPAAYVSPLAGSAGSPALVRNRLSARALGAQQIRIAANSLGAWLTWVEADEVTSSIMCASYRNGSLGPTLNVGVGSLDEYGAVALPEADGTADLVFTKGRVVRGERSSSLVAYGRVSPDGRWLVLHRR